MKKKKNTCLEARNHDLFCRRDEGRKMSKWKPFQLEELLFVPFYEWMDTKKNTFQAKLISLTIKNTSEQKIT